MAPDTAAATTVWRIWPVDDMLVFRPDTISNLVTEAAKGTTGGKGPRHGTCKSRPGRPVKHDSVAASWRGADVSAAPHMQSTQLLP